MDAASEPRNEIEHLDRELVRLLAERLAADRANGCGDGADPTARSRDEQRERELFAAWARNADEQGISSYFAGRVLREILEWSRSDRAHPFGARTHLDTVAIRIGYRGSSACDGDLVARTLFPGHDVERVAYASFAAVADALEACDLDYALLPIDDRVSGSVDDVYELLGARRMTIVGEELRPVGHCLVGLPDASVEHLRVVRGDPLALRQCARFLASCVGARAESSLDAAASVARGGDRSVAAIASLEAAREHGLEVLRRDVSDRPGERMRFLLLARGRGTFDVRYSPTTSIRFSLDHRRGALLECLALLETNGLDLTKLESRPRADPASEQVFFVDFEGDADDPRAIAALDALRARTSRLQVLGASTRAGTSRVGARSAAGPSSAP